MNNKMYNPRFWAVTGMILLAAFLRIMPHLPNFTPVAAMALFGGAYFSNKKIAFAVPLAAMITSDAILGFHSTMWAVYLSFVLMVLIGFRLRESRKVKNIFLAALSSSIIFFIITNFAVWTSGLMYPMNTAGLVECYTAAIPFFRYSVLGDLFFSGVFFGLFELAQSKLPALAEVKA